MKILNQIPLALVVFVLLSVGCATPAPVQEREPVQEPVQETVQETETVEGVSCFDGWQAIDEESRPVNASPLSVGGRVCSNDFCIEGYGWIGSDGAYCVETGSKITYDSVEIEGPKRGNIEHAPCAVLGPYSSRDSSVEMSGDAITICGRYTFTPEMLDRFDDEDDFRRLLDEIFYDRDSLRKSRIGACLQHLAGSFEEITPASSRMMGIVGIASHLACDDG